MLGTLATCTLVTVEIGLVAYSMHRQGVFKKMYNKFTERVVDTVTQPNLKELTWR